MGCVLIIFIIASDVQTMEETVLEMKYDAKKAPLGETRTMVYPLP